MMNTKNFFMGACSFLLIAGLGMLGSACSSKKEDTFDNSIPPKVYYPFGDYLMDVKDVTGTMHYDKYLNTWYIENDHRDRYYMYPKSPTAVETEKINKLCSEGAVVQFDGKVYAFDEDWVRDSESVYKLSLTINLYVMKLPDFSIRRLQDDTAETH